MVTVKQVKDTPTSAGTARQHQVVFDRPTAAVSKDMLVDHGFRFGDVFDLQGVEPSKQEITKAEENEHNRKHGRGPLHERNRSVSGLLKQTDCQGYPGAIQIDASRVTG